MKTPGAIVFLSGAVGELTFLVLFPAVLDEVLDRL